MRQRHVWVIELPNGIIVAACTTRKSARNIIRLHRGMVPSSTVCQAIIKKYIPEKED